VPPYPAQWPERSSDDVAVCDKRYVALTTALARSLVTSMTACDGQLAAQPLSRLRLFGAEITTTTAAAAALVTLAGLATWAGVTAIGGDYSLAAAFAGVWNTLPIMLLSVGAAGFATGWLPRWVGAVGGIPATGGFLLLVIADSIGAPAWIRGISPFAHLTPVPLTRPRLECGNGDGGRCRGAHRRGRTRLPATRSANVIGRRQPLVLVRSGTGAGNVDHRAFLSRETESGSGRAGSAAAALSRRTA
jgi:hypothetical protein